MLGGGALDGRAAAKHKGRRSLVGIETKTNVRIRISVGSRLDLALRKQWAKSWALEPDGTKVGCSLAEHSSLPHVYFRGHRASENLPKIV